MFIISCPFCNEDIIIQSINCGIFIHAYRKDTMKQVGPHSKIKYINRLISNNNIYGCGNKFKINKQTKEVSKIELIDFNKH